MPRLALLRSAWLPWLLAIPMAAATAEAPKIYKWVDTNGIAHYTTDPERIPKNLRNRIHSIERGDPQPAPSRAATPPPTRDPVPIPEVEPDPAADPDGAAPAPDAVASTAPETDTAPPVADTTAPPVTDTTAPPVARRMPPPPSAHEDWFERDAVPEVDIAAILAGAEPTPAQLEALAAEQAALDSRIAEVQAEIDRDERFLRGLISDPDLDSDVPLFDRPEFLEVSKRLPQLQARLDELRDERAKLELP